MTKQILTLSIIALMFQSCQQKTAGKSEDNVQSVLRTKVKSEIKLDSYKRIGAISRDTCTCDWKAEKLNHNPDLTFSNNGKPFKLDALTKWIDKPARLEIKSLRLKDFDTIPAEMSIFENVESVYLEAINHKNVQGLELFPKLRILKVEEERFVLDEASKWLDRIEVIHANKTKFSGIQSFNQTPNIREVKLSFSGFDRFPADFEDLKCLSYFQTGAHTSCEIDLTQLDFTNMECLEFAEFHSWRNNIKGIPKGIKNVRTVKISHPNLTQAEKEKLEKIRG